MKQIRYRVKLTPKEGLKEVSEWVTVDIPSEWFDALSDADAELLYNEKKDRPDPWDLEQKLSERIDNPAGLLVLLIEEIREAQRTQEKRHRDKIETILSLGVDGFISYSEYYGASRLDYHKKVSGYINWKDPEISALGEEILAKVDRHNDEVERGKRELREEKQREHEHRANIRTEYLLGLMTDVEREQWKEGLMAESYARAIILREALSDLSLFQLGIKTVEDSLDTLRGALDSEHTEECICGEPLSWWSREANSITTDEYAELSRVRKALLKMNEKFATGVYHSVDPRLISFGCGVEDCTYFIDGIHGVRLTVTIGDWTLNKLFVFDLQEQGGKE